MSKIIPGGISAAFKKYAGNFHICDEKGVRDEYVAHNINLKIDHSVRVSGIAEKIAREECFSGEDTHLAVLCGLFHDIGRFEQFAKYRTFSDARSVNHAELGARILVDSYLAGDMNTGERQILIDATRAHNMKDIPEDIDEVSLPFARLVRDADKIDILEIFCEYLPLREKTRNAALELDLPETDEYNPEILEKIYRGETIPNSLRRSTTDMRIIHVAWVLDLNYRASYAEIIRRRTIERLACFLPKNDTIDELVRYLLECAEKNAH